MFLHHCVMCDKKVKPETSHKVLHIGVQFSLKCPECGSQETLYSFNSDMEEPEVDSPQTIREKTMLHVRAELALRERSKRNGY